MKTNLRLLSAAVGGAAVVSMGAIGVAAGTGGEAVAPAAPPMTTGETVTKATGLNATTTTTSPMSFAPVVTATPPPPAEPGG